MDACKDCPHLVACIFDPGYACYLDDEPKFFANINAKEDGSEDEK